MWSAPDRGRENRSLKRLLGDRAYSSRWHEGMLRWLGIEPLLAKRGVAHGSGLGKWRWVVERTLSWLHSFKRLRVRFDRTARIHEGFLRLACALVCWSFLKRSLC